MPEDPNWMLEFEKHFAAEVESSSDRGAVILGAAGLDAALGEVVRGACRSDLDLEALVLGKDAAGGTFSSKNSLALALGLVSDREFRDIDLVRRIRNSMAHGTGRAEFSDDSVRNRCAEFRLVDRVHFPAVIPFADAPDGSKVIPTPIENWAAADLPAVDFAPPSPDEPRERFVSEIRCLMRVLAVRSTRSPNPYTPTAPEDFDHPAAPEASLNEMLGVMFERSQQLRNEQLALLREGRALADNADEAEGFERDIADLLGDIEDAEASSRRHIQLGKAMVEYIRELHRRSTSA